MISCVSPVYSSANHSINTLRYSDRLKEKTKSKEYMLIALIGLFVCELAEKADNYYIVEIITDTGILAYTYEM